MTPDHPLRRLVPPAGWLDDPLPDDAGPSVGFLLLATLLGAALRVVDFGGPSLWVDEMLTWQVVRPGPDRFFPIQILDCIHGPLYMAVAWPLVRILPLEWALRLPSVVAGVLAVPAFGVVARRLVPGRAARLAVLVFALNPFHLWYSQEGRGYAFLVLFSLLAGLVYLEMVRRGPTVGRALLFGLAAAAAAWSNLTAVFLWLAMGATLLLVDRPTRPGAWGLWAGAFGFALVLAAPWLLKASGIWAVGRILPGATGSALRGETTFDFLALPYTIETFFYGYSLGPSLAELHGPDRLRAVLDARFLLAAAALPVGFGLAGAFRRPDRGTWRMALWVLVPMAILAVLALRNVKPWNPRYAAMTMPWVLLLAAAGLTALPRRLGLFLAVLLTGLTLWSVGNYFVDGRYAKADVRGAVAYVHQNDPAPAEPVFVPSVTAVYRYYDKGSAPLIATYGLEPLGRPAAADAVVDSLLAGVDSCWYVEARSWYFDPHGLLPPALARRGHLGFRAAMDGVKIYHWERTSPAEDEHGP